MQHLGMLKFTFPSDVVDPKTLYSLINHFDKVRLNVQRHGL